MYNIDENRGDILYEVDGDKVILKIKEGVTSSSDNSSIEIIKTNDNTTLTEENVLSSLRALSQFIRKDINERIKNKLSSDSGFEVGTYVEGKRGGIFSVNANGESYAEIDELVVRLKYLMNLRLINSR